MTTRHQAVDALLAAFGDAANLPAAPVALTLAAAALVRLEADGGEVCDELREVLDGPPLPVIEFGPPSFGAVGAKPLAMLILEPRGEQQDAARYERLAESEAEPLAVRLAAARAWFDSDPADTTPELVDLLLRGFPVERDSAEQIVAPFRDVIDTLIPPLVGHLYHRLMNHRLRARRLLVAAGHPAVASLRQVVETTEDSFARADAAAALAELDETTLVKATERLHLSLREILKTDDRRNILGASTFG